MSNGRSTTGSTSATKAISQNEIITSFCVVDPCSIAIGIVNVSAAAAHCAVRPAPSDRATDDAATRHPASPAHCTALAKRSDPASSCRCRIIHSASGGM